MKWSTSRQEAGRVRGALWWGTPYDGGPHLDLDFGKSGKYPFTDIGFTFGGEDRDLGVNLGLWWFTFYVSLGGVLNRWRKGSYGRAKERAELVNSWDRRRGMYAYMLDPFDGRTTSIRVFDGSVWVDIWKGGGGWNNTDTPGFRTEWEKVEGQVKKVRRTRWQWGYLPWNCLGWNWTFHVQNWLIGDTKCERIHQETTDHIVRMPEGDYPCTIKIDKVRWNRRWWNGAWKYQIEVAVDKGVPHAGKGTTSYNCDDDATYSMSWGEDGKPFYPGDMADRFAIRLLETRQKYGGINWEPAGGWPSHCRRPLRAS